MSWAYLLFYKYLFEYALFLHWQEDIWNKVETEPHELMMSRRVLDEEIESFGIIKILKSKRKHLSFFLCISLLCDKMLLIGKCTNFCQEKQYSFMYSNMVRLVLKLEISVMWRMIVRHFYISARVCLILFLSTSLFQEWYPRNSSA
jgi:radical SAM superfamily enzyme with C-terminal helix-hairpin-helix motif